MNTQQVFKKCQNCSALWRERSDFVGDETVNLIGYQPNFVKLSKGLFLFNHSCGTTLSVNVHKFSDLYPGPIFTNSLSGSSDCLGYCLHKNDLRPCPAKCECAYVRFVIGALTNQ